MNEQGKGTNISINRIARIFPRRTNATPKDDMAFVNRSPPMDMPEVDEVHVSVAFTYDIPVAEQLAENWRTLGVPVKLGGPAYDAPGGEFVPGMYLKDGYVITSRGCPKHGAAFDLQIECRQSRSDLETQRVSNLCGFCSVPKREGALRELEIKNGWNVLDDNLLACSDAHIRAVFDMLQNQFHAPVLSGGLEAKRLKPWHVELIRQTKVKRMYFAYDTPDDLEPLIDAGRLLQAGGISVAGHRACCYVLIGYPGDTFSKAEFRLMQTVSAGFMPYAMLYRDKDGITDAEWRRFQREWIRPGALPKSLILPVRSALRADLKTLWVFNLVRCNENERRMEE